jgi:2-haloacid dehalogenase
MSSINTVIFDLGGVLIDWNPKYLYRKIFKTEDEVEWFLANICTSEWNDQQDAGRSFEEATRELILKHPEWSEPINAWYARWQETISGPIAETVEILKTMKESGRYKLYALTNWSAETFPWAYDNFLFLHWFHGIVVSGIENTRKPYPEFYRILFNRFNVNPSEAVFIDDNIRNVEGAKAVGLEAIHFQNPAQMKEELAARGIVLFDKSVL